MRRRTQLFHIVAVLAVVAGVFTAITGFCRAEETQKPELRTDLDSVRIQIGDVVTFKIRAGFGTAAQDAETSGYRFIFPGDDLDVSPFTVVDRSLEAPETGPDGIWETLVLKLSVYEVGEFEIPPVTVAWEGPGGATGEMTTEPEYIQVQSVLSGEEQSPRQLRPPISVAARPVYIAGVWLAVLLFLTAVWTAVVWIRRFRRRAAGTVDGTGPEPQVPAHEIALSRLDRLKTSEYLSRGQIKPFFVDLTEILKEYIGARFAFLAVEHTTDEIRRDIRTLVMAPAIRSDILEVLQLADMVKFAKYLPPDDTCRDALDRVRRVVVNTMEPRESVAENPGEPPESHDTPTSEQVSGRTVS